MIPIFTPMKDGQGLMPEVMNGIISQSLKCCLIPITSKGGSDEKETNKINNLLRALKINKTNSIILMDSDVVIGNPTMIEEMMMDKSNMEKEIILVTTKKEELIKCSHSPHSLMLIKGLMLFKFMDFLESREINSENDDIHKNCSVCQFLKGKEDNCCYIQNHKNYEISRLDLQK